MKEFVRQYGIITFMSALTLTILIVVVAHAANVRVGATVTFIRTEKISLQGRSFTLAMDQPGAPVYQVRQTGNEKIIIIE